MVKVLGIGDNVCDVYLHRNVMFPGGQALNVAVYAQMLGAQSAFIGVNGTDEVASHILTVLNSKGVDHSHSRQIEGENGFACVDLVNGDRVFQGSNRGGVLQHAPIVLNENDLEYASEFDIIHTTNNGFLDNQLPILSKCGSFISYDFSYRWNEDDRIARVCPYIDFGFVSCSELDDAATEELCRRLQKYSGGVIVATRGSRSAIAFDGSRYYEQKPYLVNPVDTIGAGDGFAACMLVNVVKKVGVEDRANWRNGEGREDVLPSALDIAADFAANVCLVEGAFGCPADIPEQLRPSIHRVINNYEGKSD